MAALPSGEPSWWWRRLVFFLVLLAGLYELHMLGATAEPSTAQQLITTWAMLVGGVVVVYTGFASAQDIVAIWRARTGLPYREEDRGPQ